MRLRLLAIDPETTGEHCPAVLVDEDSGDLFVQGDLVTDEQALAQIDAHSRTAPHEGAVRLPARMAETILEALRGDPDVR